MNGSLGTPIVQAVYLVSAFVFVVGMKKLAKVRTARAGNAWAALGMAIAVVTTVADLGALDWSALIGSALIGSALGAALAYRLRLAAMLKGVAALNAFGGAASALVVVALLGMHTDVLGRLFGAIAIAFGAITVGSSLLGFVKLSSERRSFAFAGRALLAAVLGSAVLALVIVRAIAVTPDGISISGALALTGLVLGGFLTLTAGRPDATTVVSLSNAYSGFAACALGLAISNILLVIGGALVGVAGLVITKTLCDASGRSLGSVVVGKFAAASADGAQAEYGDVRSCGVEEAVMVLEEARSIVIVPGYGLAVAQAQHAARELGALLEKRGASVRFAIHPVAGRMPGHMNVLLGEADVPYHKLVEVEQINPELAGVDVAIVVGANDVVNASARDPDSPYERIPAVEVSAARNVFVIKRSLAAGYSGLKNQLFLAENTALIYGDAKKVLQGLAAELKGSGSAHAA